MRFDEFFSRDVVIRFIFRFHVVMRFNEFFSHDVVFSKNVVFFKNVAQFEVVVRRSRESFFRNIDDVVVFNERFVI